MLIKDKLRAVGLNELLGGLNHTIYGKCFLFPRHQRTM
jgi:hypothetical protein